MFEKVTAITDTLKQLPDPRHLMFHRMLLTKLDHRIDAVPPAQWDFGEVTLGDQPSPFLQKFLTYDIRNVEIPAYLRWSSDNKEQGRADIYTELNLICANLQKISQCARDHQATCSDETKTAYIAANQQLFDLCTLYMLYPTEDVAKSIRAGTAANEAGNSQFDAIHAHLMQEFPDVPAKGHILKTHKDSLEWLREVRMEIEHGSEGFLKSNLIVEALRRQGIDIKRDIYAPLQSYFEANKKVPREALSEKANQVIDTELTKIEPYKAQYGIFFKILGLDLHPKEFNTKVKDEPYRPQSLSPLEHCLDNINKILMVFPKTGLFSSH